MKKIFAVVMAMVMLIPMLAGIPAVSAEGEKKPFYMVNWAGVETNGVDTSDINNVYPATYFWASNAAAIEGYLTVKAAGTFDMKQMAEALKADFDKRPAGTRYINFAAPQSIFPEAAENYVFLEKGFEMIRDWLDAFLAYYSQIGGKLDGMLSDMEYFNCMWYWLQQWHYNGDDPDAYYKIVSDPRYATEIRPLLEERGFKFYPSNEKDKTEIYSINLDATSEDPAYAVSRRIWDVVMRNRCNQYLTKYMYETMARYYPNAEFNDYQARNSYAWLKETERDGVPIYEGGNYIQAGTSSNNNFYAHRPDDNFFGGYYGNPAGHNGAYYEETVFNKALFDYTVFKNMYAASGKISAWTAFYDYNYGDSQDGAENQKVTVSNTPYYSEILFHMNLLDPTPFIGFIVPDPSGGGASTMYAGSGEDYVKRIRVVEQILDEMTRVAGYADRKPIVTPYTWNDSFLLSGMYAGGRNIWRITPDTSKVSLEAFKVEATDPTFYVNGKTVSFPGGKIVETGSISEVGTCGYWVETPKDTVPVVISDPDRMQKDPALLFDFENMEIGANFTSQTALPKQTWQVKGEGSAAVKKHGTDNALALTGSVQLWNVTIPGYVRAGDTYAKDQAWEVTVHVPVGLGGSAALSVLMCNDDGGFKIAGGKVYYDESGAYKEMSGVTVVSNSQYTFKRLLDLNGFTCSYYVYDQEGALLGKEENVPMLKTELPVPAVGFVGANLNKLVYIDDYTIYTTGIGADLEIYNATTGIKLADVAQTRTADTAYRFSWHNASQTTRRGAVVAYRNGVREVIKQVQLLPGTDGVETGIVKSNGAGLQIKWEWDDTAAYTVTVEGGLVDRADATPGETVSLVAGKIPAEKNFLGWIITGDSAEVTFADASKGTTTFVMPAGNVSVKAVFKGTLYDATVTGEADASGSGQYEEGETVTIHAGTAPAGMVFDKWVVEEGSAEVAFADEASAATTFVMPAQAVSVKATWKELPPETTEEPTTEETEPVTEPVEQEKPDKGGNLTGWIVAAVVIALLAGVSVVGVIHGRKYPEKMAQIIAPVKKLYDKLAGKVAGEPVEEITEELSEKLSEENSEQ